MTATVTLYHGTTKASAERMIREGWWPHSHPSGGQCGNPAWLCLTNDPENALWYAQEKGCNTVVEVQVPKSFLRVDPHDGVEDTVDAELNNTLNLPGCVVCTKPLQPESFHIHIK